MKLRINVEGRTYEVEVEVIEDNKRPRISTPSVAQPASVAPVATSVPNAPPAVSNSTRTSDENKVLRSPISGVVVRVPVQQGQRVKVNDTLMALEAMKMETVITSHYEGKISAIHACTGDSVQVEQVLIEFE